MNRLGSERSPYLLQHAGNPVDWYPWGEDAFARARREDKPIFLSIGYSTCHWCHVMEHESFENPAIADLLNRDFVSIKVDREERPDVDRVYMSFVQATTGSGGWPMTVFLTPELKPFFGGTYFPPSSRWGRPGFSDLLRELARVWREDRPRVEGAAAELLQRLRAVTATDGAARAESEIAPAAALDIAVEQFRSAFDERRGGFGEAPKFPRPSELLFLLREHARRAAAGDPPGLPLRMATETLRAMALGGMRDHIGGGFHRYSVDGDWRVPHFEKMLYDQAQLVLAYLEAAQATGDDFYAAVAADTLEYVRRDMTDAGGAFYSAEDADSLPPGQTGVAGAHKTEGAFYVWSDEEIATLLGADADIARRRFGIKPGGNAPQDPQGEFTAKNLLYTAQSIEGVAAATGRTREDVGAALVRIRQTLFRHREGRPRPHLDDKILTAWNGLMIAAFARAARVLVDRPSARGWLDAAGRAARFVKSTLWVDGRLLRRYRAGDAAIDAYAEDHAYLVWGLLELFQAGGDAEWLEWAIALQSQQDEKFWDEKDGGWFSTTGNDPTVLLRLKEDYDGAEPAASSVAALNALTLSHLTADEHVRGRAARTLARYGPRIGGAGRTIPMMLCALSGWHAGYAQLVIAGAADRAAPLARELARHYRPFTIVIPLAPGAPQGTLAGLLPFTAAMTDHGGAAAYVCRDFTCRQPATTPEALARQL
ncbi:MAG: thioredoxin domain-containing protein [Acidobacteriota bacterium]|nr:thioredoxin domain-containing protein [Acidobacteriota bacterium]